PVRLAAAQVGIGLAERGCPRRTQRRWWFRRADHQRVERLRPRLLRSTGLGDVDRDRRRGCCSRRLRAVLYPAATAAFGLAPAPTTAPLTLAPPRRWPPRSPDR